MVKSVSCGVALSKSLSSDALLFMQMRRTIAVFFLVLAACGNKQENGSVESNGDARQRRRLQSYAQELFTSTRSREVPHDSSFVIDVTVKNAGREPWPAGGQPGDKAGWVDLSYRWLDASGAEIPIEGKRTLLFPREMLKPGESAELRMQAVAPPNQGNLTLRISMVHEGITWFYSAGGKPLDLPMKVD